MSGSIHDKLGRVRKPRVHISYEVETEGAAVKKELPFVVGVLGDFSGNPTSPLKPLKDRKFVQIDRDNFDDIMSKMTPGLSMKVDNVLEEDGSQIQVDMAMNSMADFDPARVVEQVEPLKKLMDTRNKLRDLLTKVDRSDDLEAVLEDALQSPEGMSKLAQDLGVDAPAGGEDGDA